MPIPAEKKQVEETGPMPNIEKFSIYAIADDIIYNKNANWSEIEKGTQIIYIFGRTPSPERKKVIKVVTPYYNYFYIKEEDRIPVAVEKYVYQNASYLYQPAESLDGEKVKRIYTLNNKAQKEIVKILDQEGIKHFEADITPRMRFILDNYEKLRDRGITFDVADCRISTLDIETTTSHSEFPEPFSTPEAIIAITTHDSYDDEYTTYTWRGDQKVDTVFDLSRRRKTRIYDNEQRMLDGFLRDWKIMSPDIIVSWNGNNFDIPYIINRCKKLNMRTYMLSPVDRVWMWHEERPNGEYYYNPNITGVVLFDSLHWYREVVLNELRGYSLAVISKVEGVGEKDSINPEEYWQGTKWLEMLDYNVNDVYLTKAITEKKKLIDFVNGIRKTTMCNFEDLVYFSRSIDSMLLQAASVRKQVLPTKPVVKVYQSKADREAQYTGAIVSAERGLYKNVGVFDFNSLYPQIIKTFNLSKELINEQKIGRELNNVWFNTNKRGLLPIIIDSLLKMRVLYEQGLKASKTAKEAEDYDNMIQAVKNLICCVYGIAANQSYRLFDQRVASTITFCGRELISEMERFAKEKYAYNTRYKDTDSMFIEMPEFDLMKGLELQEEFNKHIKDYCWERWKIQPEENTLSLKFEKMYNTLLVDSKKRYAGWLTWKKGKEKDDITIAGIQARRSDSSSQLHYLQPKVLELILKAKTEAEVEQVIMDEVKKIIEKEPDYEYLAFPVRIGKANYQNDLPKTRGIEYAKKLLGKNFQVGTKPLLVYLEGEEDAICFENNNELKGKGVKLNCKKMIERNVLLPLESILTTWKGEEYYSKIKSRIDNQLNNQTDLLKFI